MGYNGGANGNEDFLERKSGTADGEDGVALVIPTAINATERDLRFYNSITCFFDKWWTPASVNTTLPFAFFQILEWKETTPVRTQEHRVILYQPQDTEDTLTNAVAKSSIGAYIDNIEVMPREYSVSCIVPCVPFYRGFYNRTNDKWVGGKDPEDEFDITATEKALVDEWANEYNAYQKKALNALTNQFARMSKDTFKLNNVENIVNKLSLDAMAESGRIVEMKTWIGGQKVYGIISDLNLEKRFDEDGVWRATFKFIEAKVLTVAPVDESVYSSADAWFQNATQTYGSVAGYGSSATSKVAYFNQ